MELDRIGEFTNSRWEVDIIRPAGKAAIRKPAAGEMRPAEFNTSGGWSSAKKGLKCAYLSFGRSEFTYLICTVEQLEIKVSETLLGGGEFGLAEQHVVGKTLPMARGEELITRTKFVRAKLFSAEILSIGKATHIDSSHKTHFNIGGEI